MKKGDKVTHAKTVSMIHTVVDVFGNIYLLTTDEKMHHPLTKNSMSSPIVSEMVTHAKHLRVTQ